ncbi:MAG TPA: HD domain-containing phosphohydrolase [Thermodesulfovibrionales bacterium]|nr:HD domain-containing phosphohydrolase [Thermodesulfovibrionales bacterium]
MDTLRLQYPVHTGDKRLLLPAGAILSMETLDDLISSSKATSYRTHPLFKYGSVKKDLLHQMERPPYDFIFSGREKIESVMGMLEKVRLVTPVLDSLGYFKKDDYHTYCHVLMVFALSTLIARDLLPDSLGWMYEASTGPTHDIGKICVPMHVLKKVTPLTRTERRMMDHHSVAGYVLLSYFQKDPRNLAAIIARDHHERRDGSGVPRGIRLTDLAVEIIVICDVYDALISPRPYRPDPYDNRTAIEEITKLAEMNKIGWEVVKSLVAHNRREKPEHREVEVSREKRGTPPSPNFYGIVREDDNASGLAHEKRRHRRVALTGTATLKPKGKRDVQPVQTMIADISLSGMGVYADNPIEEGVSFSIDIYFVSLEGSMATVSVSGNTCFVRQIKDIYFVGIHFKEELDPIKHPSLYNYLLCI